MHARTPALSVIIPVYNVAGYLRQCLDSVANQQPAGGLEVILVDDGSTDGSSEICDEYAARDARAFVIHKQNGGASSARNAGIRAATGDYLLFVDGDDYIHPGALGKIAARVMDGEPFDVAFLCADRIWQGGAAREWAYRYDRECVRQKTPAEVLDYLTRLSYYPVSPCIKLLKRGFVTDNGLYFTEGMVCEDVDHTYGVLLAAKSFDFLDFPYYVARVREGSVMTARANAQARFRSTLYIIGKWLGVARDSERRETILAMLAAQYMYLCALYADLPAPDRKTNKKAVAELSWLLAHGVNRKFIFVRMLYALSRLWLFSYTMKKILL